MSNYNIALQNNNSSLEEIITKINKLPDAGSEEPKLQEKTVTPSTEEQIINPDFGYDGLNKVTISPIPSNYEDVGIETLEYTDLNTELENVINSLPNADSGTTGEVETCSVKISVDTGFIAKYWYSSFSEGQITSNRVDNVGNSTVLIENVVSGTFISIVPTSVNLTAGSSTGIEGLGSSTIWHVTARAGETAILELVSP